MMKIKVDPRTQKESAVSDGLLLAKLLAPEMSATLRRNAFGQIVHQFQDMAYGYAYSLLGNSDLAEEAAQEAFLAAWQNLPHLRQPAAFPAWFKRIVFTQCQDIRRRRQVRTVSWSEFSDPENLVLEGVDQIGGAKAAIDPSLALELSERHSEVRRAVAELPEGERAAVVLFYINEYSREEIAGFLGITPMAVKKRLASARRRLKERLITMVQDDLHDRRPSRDSAFRDRVLAFSRQFGDLLRSGTPILKTLELCAVAQKDSPRLVQAIREMKQQVQKGEPIRLVMDRYPDLFSERYVEAVALGEYNGTLDSVLARLAHEEPLDPITKL